GELAAARSLRPRSHVAEAETDIGDRRHRVAARRHADLEQNRLGLAAREAADRDDDARAAPPERTIEDAIELDARREIDGHLGGGGDRLGERLGLALEDALEPRLVLDEVVSAVRLLGDGRHDLFVVVDVHADGRDRHAALARALGERAEAGDVAYAVVRVS